MPSELTFTSLLMQISTFILDMLYVDSISSFLHNLLINKAPFLSVHEFVRDIV